MQSNMWTTNDIVDEQSRNSLEYGMAVNTDRALPNAADGFKPVAKRSVYDMWETGTLSSKPHRKSARIVGDTMGKYHPHGDSSIYGAIVRLAQPWVMRYPIFDGHGNFGNIGGDGPAAMRYTEIRLTKLAEEGLLAGIKKKNVDFIPNYDGEEKEPAVLPARFPNLLVNGASGIAVGMATNMPTHNLGEVIDGCCAYINNIKARLHDEFCPEITVEDLMEYVKAPDFPTGGTIYGYQGVRDAFETGRGSVVIRSNADIETDNNGREHIVITELPYGVVKSELVKKIAELVSDKKIEGISGISDQSKRDVRVIIEIKRDANAQVVLNKLYKYTALQSSFSVNSIALVKGRPQLLNLHDMVANFIEHRMEVVVRRTKFELKKAEERAHILEGLIIAVDNIDEVVRIIRASRTPADAQANLEARFELDNLQSKAIVDMRLAALTGLRIDELKREYEELQKLIAHLNELLANEEMRYDVIPAVIYTDPEVASVGHSKEGAEKLGMHVKEVKLPMSYAGRYLAENEGGKGFIKLIVDTDRNRLVGCHMVGSYASEIIMTATMMVDTELPPARLQKMVFPHPTVAEIIREAIFHV